MKRIDLRMNELEKYHIIKRVVYGEINKERAAIKLNCSLRTVFNLVNKYRLHGKQGFIHGNRDRLPSKTLSCDIVKQIVLLYSNKYAGTNFKHFQELLAKIDIHLSYCSLYKILTKAGFISPKCHRITRKNKNKELKAKLISKTKLLPCEAEYIAITHLQDHASAHPRKPRAKYFGELIQMDASEHLWFGNTKCFLHLAIDDATGAVVGAYFSPQETLFAYYQVFSQILLSHGIPAEFLTDRRTIFEYKTMKNPSDEKDTFTQFGYACSQLGVAITTSSVAQVKGRVERVFQTLQSRLITELRLAGISDIQAANEFLRCFFEAFNKLFSVPFDYTKSVFDKQIDYARINTTLSVISKRKVDNGNAIKYKNQYYQFYDESGLVLVKPKTICYVLETFDQQLVASVGDSYYYLIALEKNHRQSITFDDDEPKQPKYKGHKPVPFHPWSYERFKAKLRRNHWKTA